MTRLPSLAIVLLVSIAGTFAAGCTYTGELEKSFHKADARDDLERGKIPLSVAIVRSAKLASRRFKAAAGGHGVDIPVGPPMIDALQAELATIFETVVVVDRTKSATQDILVKPDFIWKETYRDRRGHLDFAVAFVADMKLRKPEMLIERYKAAEKVSYSPPAGAVAAQMLQGASVYLLSPLTMPLTTEAVGAEAKKLIGETISKLVSKLGDDLVEDGKARGYADLVKRSQTDPNRVAARKSLPAEPRPPKRRKSKYDRFMDAVVTIRRAEGQGSGFFVTSDGLLITNQHVVQNENAVTVETRDRKRLIGKVIARNSFRDLALVQVRGNGFPTLRLSAGAHAEIGNDVIAIGTPEDLSWSVSRGIVSAIRDAPLVRYIQTDTPISPGSSGGPLIDLASGYVVGVNTFKAATDNAEGLNFAVASEDVIDLFRNYLGASTQPERRRPSPAAAAEQSRQ